MGWKYYPERMKHVWEQKISQPWYDRVTGSTHYPHPGRTRLGEHCTLCGVAKDYRNEDESCPEKDDMSSPHFVFPGEWVLEEEDK